jgi:hypothetical protein
MVVIAIGFLEFCHGISLWMKRSVDYKNIFLLNLHGTSVFPAFTFVIRTNARNNAVYTAKKEKTRQQRQLLQQYPDYLIPGTCASCMVFFNTVLLFINFPQGAVNADRDPVTRFLQRIALQYPALSRFA